MKKISLAVIAAALSMTSAVKADDNFSGFRASLLGDYGFVKTTDEANKVKVAGKDDANRVIDSSGFGKIGLDLGYTKVMANNMLVGASVLGFMDMSKIERASDVKAEDEVKNLAVDQKIEGGMGFGANLSLGMVFSPKIAGRLIGEVTYAKSTLTGLPAKDKTAYEWTLGAGAGAAIDFAATDRIILSVGGKYNFMPSELKYTKETNKDLANEVKFKRETSWNIFVEAGFRITQN